MKLIVLFICLTAILFGSNVTAQSQASSNSFQLEDKQIVIPAPSGFTEAASQIQAIKDRFTVTESAGNDLLAVHLPNSDYQLLKKGESANLTFWTKVSVSKKLRNETASETDFISFKEAFKKYFPAYSDPKGTVMKKVLTRISENLSGLNQEQTAVAIDKPLNLGEIVDESNSFGIVVLSQITTKIGDTERKNLVLSGISTIRVKEKIIFVYTFKDYKNEQDIADLKNFSSNWLKQIAAANK